MFAGFTSTATVDVERSSLAAPSEGESMWRRLLQDEVKDIVEETGDKIVFPNNAAELIAQSVAKGVITAIKEFHLSFLTRGAMIAQEDTDFKQFRATSVSLSCIGEPDNNTAKLVATIGGITFLVPQTQYKVLERAIESVTTEGTYWASMSGSTVKIDIAVSKGPRGAAATFKFEKATTEFVALDTPEIDSVSVDLTVALRIAKHARDCTSGFSVRGAICGLQLGNTVEVTFAYPTLDERQGWDDGSAESRDKREKERKKREGMKRTMLQMYSNEGFDTNVVGQYLAASLCSRALVELDPALDILYDRQRKMSRGILLLYDPLAASEFGMLNLTAYTLTNEYYTYVRELNIKKISLHDPRDQEARNREFLTQKVHEVGILRELPVTIRCSTLQKMMLHMVDVAPVPSSSSIINSVVAQQYLEELLSKTTMNCDQLKRAIAGQDKQNQTLLLSQLKRQTKHLVSLCDSMLLNTSIMDAV